MKRLFCLPLSLAVGDDRTGRVYLTFLAINAKRADGPSTRCVGSLDDRDSRAPTGLAFAEVWHQGRADRGPDPRRKPQLDQRVGPGRLRRALGLNELPHLGFESLDSVQMEEGHHLGDRFEQGALPAAVGTYDDRETTG